MTTAQLFEVVPHDVAITSDDWYTPRWLFDAAGLTFDLDVCAPVNPSFRTCPAKHYLTIIEDGLTADWHGTVWMNPPFSNPAPWVDKWAQHASGLAIVPEMPRVHRLGILMAAADALMLIDAKFGRPDGFQADLRWSMLLVARGQECVQALARIAAADRYAAGAYHVRPVR